jgi:hypothetical protein
MMAPIIMKRDWKDRKLTITPPTSIAPALIMPIQPHASPHSSPADAPAPPWASKKTVCAI